MKKCVKIISILLTVCLLFTSCSADFDELVKLFSSATVFEINGEIPGDGILDTEFFGDTAVVLSYDHFEDGEEEYYTQYFLTRIDAKKAKAEYSVELENCPLNDPYMLDRNEYGDILVIGYESEVECEMSVAYSFETFEQKGETEEYTAFLPATERKDNPFGFDFIQGETITSLDYTDIPNQAIHVYAMRFIPDEVVFANGLDFSIFSTHENLAAGMENSPVGEDGNTETIVVYDFENSVLVNRLTHNKPQDENKTSFIISGYANDKYVLFDENNGDLDTEEYHTKYYIWRYRKDALNEPFDAEKKTVDDLTASNEKLCEQIKNDTGINVYINSDKFDFYKEDEDYYLSRNANPLEANIMLTRIKFFLDLLPEGFAKEMYSDLEIFQYDGFDIFIGDSVKGTASAYASSFLNNLTIAFGTSSSDFRTVAHEFMHIMDTRIEDRLGMDTSFYSLWCEYNPDGFEYHGLDDDGYYEDDTYEKNEDWFISAYSMATDAEDRAEIFSYLIVDAFSDELPPEWYRDKEHLRIKTDYLTEMIRNAYPSLENVKTALWEKTAEAYKKQVTFVSVDSK